MIGEEGERKGMESGTVVGWVGWVGKGERRLDGWEIWRERGVWWRSRLRGNLIRGGGSQGSCRLCTGSAECQVGKRRKGLPSTVASSTISMIPTIPGSLQLL